MPKKKKYPRLRNGFGSIRNLGKGRTNPYAAFPPSTKRDDLGRPVYEKAIAYCDTWEKAFSTLLLYHNGKFRRGGDTTNLLYDVEHSDLSPVVNRILSVLDRKQLDGETFSEVYEKFMKWKFVDKKPLSKSAERSYKTAFKNCKALHNRTFASLKTVDLQKVVDDCPLKHASKELIVNLFKQMYKFADIYELVEKDYSAHVVVNVADEDEHGIPFSHEEIDVLWKHKSDYVCANLLILIYSGFRISEYEQAEINLKENYFYGGLKTKAGKNRYVPIHPDIKQLIKNNLERLRESQNSFRLKMYERLSELGIAPHTPHDCRHTFAMLCDEYGIKETDKKMMLGHSFKDVTNKVYGHRTLEYLSEQIRLIKIKTETT